MSGDSVKPWSGEAVTKARKALAARHFPLNTPCCICGQPIDYRLPGNDPDGMSIQHVLPRSTHPHLTWDQANWEPAHLQCNKAAGTTIQSGLGIRSKRWK